VVAAKPDNGDTNVDPALNVIRVEFDQDMRRDGYSWTTGRDQFPKLRGRPKWIGKRVCVLPVALEPNTKYWVGVNSEKYRRFVSADGEAAVPYAIAFETGAPRKRAGGGGLTPQENHEAVRELRRAIEDDYSYRDLRAIDWDRVFADYAPRLENAKTPKQFAEIAVEMLSQAKDIHITVSAEGQTFPSFRRSIMANFNMAVLRSLVPRWTKRSNVVYGGKYDDGIGYIMILSWARSQAESLEAAFGLLGEAHQAGGLIIDVRANSGGDESLAREFAGCFVAEPVVYARHVYRSQDQPGGFSKPRDRVLQPSTARPRYRGKVAVLCGAVNMSSAEAFLLMMKQVPGCKLFGSRTYGSSGNPQPTALPNGVTVMLPAWQALRPDGTLLEGAGLTPDVVVETSPEALASGDPVLEAALAWLRG
jgi:hypothetical protein